MSVLDIGLVLSICFCALCQYLFIRLAYQYPHYSKNRVGPIRKRVGEGALKAKRHNPPPFICSLPFPSHHHQHTIISMNIEYHCDMIACIFPILLLNLKDYSGTFALNLMHLFCFVTHFSSYLVYISFMLLGFPSPEIEIFDVERICYLLVLSIYIR